MTDTRKQKAPSGNAADTAEQAREHRESRAFAAAKTKPHGPLLSRLMVYSMLSFIGFSILISIVTPILAGTGGLLLLLVNLDNDLLFATTVTVIIILYICSLLFFVWLFAYFMNRKVLRPIHRLTTGLRKITGGDHTVRLDEKFDYEFEEVRDAFNYMAEKLEEAERSNRAYEAERSMIFSNISHDLKTPISTIAGYAGALSDGMVTDEAQQREYLRTIQTKALHMNDLVELLFEYARLDNSQYRLRREPVELTEFLRGVLASAYGDFESASLELETALPDCSVPYIGDRLELSRAIMNLISNAIRHNTSGHTVTVTLETADGDSFSSQRRPDEIAILVSDNGEKIAPELATELFTPFVVGDASRSSRGGSGLGLAITRKIAERHGGRVAMIDGPEGHTKSFVIYLPGTPVLPEN